MTRSAPVADVPRPRFDMILFRRRSMRSLLRNTFLAASALVVCWGMSGCSSDTNSDTGKMAGPMDNTDTGKMAGPMDNTDTGKMAGPMDNTDAGKMAGPMDN